ncbi:hypothetical protein L873DRAFT_1809758 [Choiromyces venosus 120613-1]|uniref:Uncharacterized protein n=1 Tax=Choiromyces venosus 120613-1 TaxID=1336337 RepID=A0A3N4JJM9_9PEZI|nr:hypothetical protein L873DRAFT_1809758 [Choiromyces venosus 120613-1]
MDETDLSEKHLSPLWILDLSHHTVDWPAHVFLPVMCLATLGSCSFRRQVNTPRPAPTFSSTPTPFFQALCYSAGTVR